MDVSRKYRDDPHALAKSVDRVINGSTGVWGKVPMIPHRQHSRDEVYSMVSWVYDLRDVGPIQVQRGFVGEVQTDEQESGGVVLEASYTDLGAGAVPPITGTASLRLRSRHIEAEHANVIRGSSVLNSETANNEKFMGSIYDGHHLRFDDIDFGAIGKVTARVASGGTGGFIEFRRGKLDGRLLAKIYVESNGGWEDWRDQSGDFQHSDGIDDLFVVFKQKDKGGALLNLDSIYLSPR